MDWIISRLKEPSTWAGIATVVAGASFIPNASEWAALIPAAGVVIGGALAIIMGEKK